jgi:hypothetical protein
MMGALMEGDNPKYFQTGTAYVGGLNEVVTQRQISAATPLLSNSFRYKLQRAKILRLTFAEDKSELIHFSLASRRKIADGQSMIMPDQLSFSEIQPFEQIKLLGVTLDNTLTFIVHAHNAASRSLQILGSLSFLRKRGQGISPAISRYLIITKVMPRMLWASPIWWMGAHTILHPLALAYHRTYPLLPGALKS